MVSSNRILTVDIGASTVKLGEFTVTPSGGLQLANLHRGELGLEVQENYRRRAIVATIQRLLQERKIQPGNAAISVSGQSVFTRFVKLPVVEEKKVLQIVKYEAAQNVPSPIDEVVWDYQLIGGPDSASLDVVLVAIKYDIIEKLVRDVSRTGINVSLADVSTMALYNAVRYNYSGMDGSTMLLDIGARTTNLIFIEKQNIFSRNMPIGGQTSTQAIATELKMSFAEAEELKRKIGFVGLGGAYEEPSAEQAEKVSKIIRNVMTLLHAGISQTINFYRTQHNGSMPARMLLAGGSSIMPYTDQFFREKLNIEVSYFNPLRAVELGPGISKDELAKCGHCMGELVGLALRRLTSCPMEVNLLPVEYAGLGSRGVAKLVDLSIEAAATAGLYFTLQGHIPLASSTLFGLITVAFLMFHIGFSVLFLERFAATPGKMAVRLKVVSPAFEPISGVRAFARSSAELLSPWLALAGYWMAAFDPEKRTLHDLVCNTRVVRIGRKRR